MTAAAQTRLWLAQRASAAVLAFCVVVHLAVIIYAVRGGLSAAEILARTQGSLPWAGFYALFVVAVAVHASVGVRAVALEWLHLRGRALGVLVALVAAVLLGLGLRAVWAVYA